VVRPENHFRFSTALDPSFHFKGMNSNAVYFSNKIMFKELDV